MDKCIYICPRCDEKFLREEDGCGHNLIIVNCTHEEYLELYKKQQLNKTIENKQKDQGD